MSSERLAAAAPVREATAARPAPRPGIWLPIATLWWRELVHFYRQRSRVAAALGTPLLFWLLIGSGFGRSFRPAGDGQAGYLEYFFPGTILLIVLFTAIFSTLSVIEDRREGFLLSVLVAPIPRSALVLGKLLGGTTLALLQGLACLLIAPLAGIPMTPLRAAEAAAVLGLIAFGLTALGFFFAWRLDSVQGFHGVMNLVLMPMWLLSGALFPISGAHAWVRVLMLANPLTYGLAALRRTLYEAPPADTPSLALSAAATVAFGLIALAAALWQTGRPSAGGAA